MGQFPHGPAAHPFVSPSHPFCYATCDYMSFPCKGDQTCIHVLFSLISLSDPPSAPSDALLFGARHGPSGTCRCLDWSTFGSCRARGIDRNRTDGMVLSTTMDVGTSVHPARIGSVTEPSMHGPSSTRTCLFSVPLHAYHGLLWSSQDRYLANPTCRSTNSIVCSRAHVCRTSSRCGCAW